MTVTGWLQCTHWAQGVCCKRMVVCLPEFRSLVAKVGCRVNTVNLVNTSQKHSQISTSVAKTFHFQKVFCNSLFQRCFALSTGALWGIECGYVPSCFFVCGGNHQSCTKPRVGVGDAEAIRLHENSNLFHYWWTFRTPKTVKFPNLLKNFGYFWLQNASVSGYMTNHLGQAEVTINCRP